MEIIFALLLSFFGCVFAKSIQELSNLNITEIIEAHGYPVETHQIQTEDGYLLQTYRIPHGKVKSGGKVNGTPCIVNHGLMGSAENYIWMGPNKSLSFVLADNGYDVWLMNSRGSWHGRNHATLDANKDAAFWQFTWHEIGVYDIPANIDYILNVTKKTKLHYVGHSQGCSTLFVMGSERPEYNDKINVMIAMGPGAIYKNMRHPIIRMMVSMIPSLKRLAERWHVNEMPPFMSAKKLRAYLKHVCGHDYSPVYLCKNILFSIGGNDPEMFDTKFLPIISATAPSECSLKQAFHYAQLIQSGRFEKYDWGPEENLRRYNSSIALQYNFGNITFPVAIFYGDGDMLVTKEDVALLAPKLPNLVEYYRVPYDNWTHLDFLWGKNISQLLNPRILKLMNRFRNK